MNVFKKSYYLHYQFAIRLISGLSPWRVPTVIHGQNSFSKMFAVVDSKGLKKALLVTDKNILALGLDSVLNAVAKNHNIQIVCFDKVESNCTAEIIEAAYANYKKEACDFIIALGGGSVLDCAKGLVAKCAKPNKTLSDMRGLLKVGKSNATLFAIPTTSGSGNEATAAASVYDKDKREKYVLCDPSLIPNYVLLSEELQLSLPKPLTAATGIDALSHAIEAYIGRGGNSFTKQKCVNAVKLIFENLKTAYDNGEDIAARENMLFAAHDAGVAYTRAFGGYAHGLAQAVAGEYGANHSVAVAVILPKVLKQYGGKINKKLARLADAAGLCDANDDAAVKAKKFLEELDALERYLNIPATLAELKNEDIERLAEAAEAISNPLYPVPVFWEKQDFVETLKTLVKA